MILVIPLHLHCLVIYVHYITSRFLLEFWVSYIWGHFVYSFAINFFLKKFINNT